jgi:hypothetical protein
LLTRSATLAKETAEGYARPSFDTTQNTVLLPPPLECSAFTRSRSTPLGLNRLKRPSLATRPKVGVWADGLGLSVERPLTISCQSLWGDRVLSMWHKT